MDDASEHASTATLLGLPPEILYQILSHLECPSLLCVLRTCKLLQKHAEDELLWANLIRQRLPDPLDSPSPLPTFRELYIAHHPHWFLTKHRLWFSDNAHTGKLMLVKYDQRRSCIKGYRLLGCKAKSNLAHWSKDPAVIIQSFEPTVTLHHDRPVIKLEHRLHSAPGMWQGWWAEEVRMKIGSELHDSVFSSFFLSRTMPRLDREPSMELWPPRTIPAEERARSGSPDRFYGWADKPRNSQEISEKTFRLRTWMQFSVTGSAFGVRMGDEASTWSMLEPELYTPTTEKPYQGIWVGDYAGHGCEFLLIMQRETVAGEDYLPSSQVRARRDSDLMGDNPDLSIVMATTPNHLGDDSGFSGRIEAVKLTGDVNVPRGEYSWIANDIGSAGFIRQAEEEPFKGARVVKSRGHLAARGFTDGLSFDR